MQPTRCRDERPALVEHGSPGGGPSHRVACHWVEQIASGELQPHAVAPTATTQEDWSGDEDAYGPVSAKELKDDPYGSETWPTGAG